MSGPTRDPWIEIKEIPDDLMAYTVGSHTGPVD